MGLAIEPVTSSREMKEGRGIDMEQPPTPAIRLKKNIFLIPEASFRVGV
jgi:hypothetical protein